MQCPWINYNHGRGGRGGHGGRGGYSSALLPPKTPAPPSPPIGPLITTIDDPIDCERILAKITDCELIASYNWLNHPSPTILIPGKPPIWTPLKEPTRLKEDTGDYFRDGNAARYPAHPNEAATRAIFTINPSFHAGEIDFFACGCTLGHLLRFVKGPKPSFRMLVEVIGSTVFLVRRENEPTELLRDLTGFGHTFPEAYTTWEDDVKGSTSHQRIMKYRFGGLNLLVRFEGDGYLGDQVDDVAEKGSESVVLPNVKNEDGEKVANADDLLAMALEGANLGEKHPTTDSKLSVRHGGKMIPSKALFDLKTRWMKKDKDRTLEEETPRLWARQTPNFILARYQQGIFNDIHVIDVQNKVKEWEARNQEALSRLVCLLRDIKDLGSEGISMLELRCREGVIEVREPTANVESCLEIATKEKWAAATKDSEHRSGSAVGLEPL